MILRQSGNDVVIILYAINDEPLEAPSLLMSFLWYLMLIIKSLSVLEPYNDISRKWQSVKVLKFWGFKPWMIWIWTTYSKFLPSNETHKLVMNPFNKQNVFWVGI